MKKNFSFWEEIILLAFLLFPVISYAERAELWIKNLESENTLIRKNAVFYLGKMKEARAIPDLVKLLDNPVEEDLEITIISALGKIGDLSVLPFLRKRYMKINKKNDVLKKAYIQAISRLEKIYEYRQPGKQE